MVGTDTIDHTDIIALIHIDMLHHTTEDGLMMISILLDQGTHIVPTKPEPMMICIYHQDIFE